MNSGNAIYRLAVVTAITLGIVTLLLGGCVNKEANPADGIISDVTMSTDVDQNGLPINPTDVFTTDTHTLYLSFKISGFPVGTEIKAEWIYVGGDPDTEDVVGQDFVAETQTATVMKKGGGYTYTTYSRPNAPGYEFWPKGNYKVVLSVDGLEKASTTFRIE
jgi:hypothetical protein